MASAKETELGVLFEKCQKMTSVRTALSEMGHQQPQTPVATDNTAVNSIVNRTAEKYIQSKRYEILSDQRQDTKKPFPRILGNGKEKPSGLCHKTPPNMAP